MKSAFFPVLFASLWAVSTASNVSAERSAPDRPEASRERGERDKKPDARRPAEKRDGTERATPKQTWLGVATAPLPQALREYLEVEPGFGVQIFQIIEKSPATDAGLKAKDVLMLFGDQMLISPEHLSLLVKRLKKDDEVRVTVIRKGQEKVLNVTLGEVELRPVMRGGGPDGDRNFRPGYGPGNPHSRQWEETMRRQQDHFQKWMKDHEEKRDLEKETPSQGEPTSEKPPEISVRPGFPVKVLTAEGVIKIDNEKGELVITNDNGKHEMLLKDKEGKTVYEGGYDPEAGTKSLPEEAQKHLKEMKLDDLKVLTPNAPAPKPENASQPLERASLEDGRSRDLL